MGVTELVFSYKHLNLKLRVSLTGYTVAMVTCYVTTMFITYSTRTGHLFQTDKEWLYWSIILYMYASLQIMFFSKQVICQSRDNIDLTRSQSGLVSFVPYGLSLLKVPGVQSELWKVFHVSQREIFSVWM